MSSSNALGKALHKVFDRNDPIVRDTYSFDRKVGHFFNKKAALRSIREYLVGASTSPRVPALIVYSSKGNSLVKNWIEEKNMPSMLLYKALLHDGSSWLDQKGNFPLFDMIVDGNDKWDFDPHQMFKDYSSLTCFPGFMEALIERLRRKGEIEKVFLHMPFSNMADLLSVSPDVFKEEQENIPQRLLDKVKPNRYFEDMAICLVRTHLSPDQALAKMLGSGY